MSSHDGLPREARLARTSRVDAPAMEHRAESGHEARLLQELRVHQTELEAQNAELREAQIELEESHRRYQKLYDFAPIAYLTFDSAGCIVEANVTAEEMFGVDRAFLHGRPFIGIARSLDAELFFGHLRQCLASTSSVVAEMSFTTRRGAREVRATSMAVADPAGARRLVRSAFFDIGVFKDSERERQRARAAEAELRRLERIAAAHVAITQAITRMRDDDVMPVLLVLADQARTVTGARYAAVGIGTEEDAPFAPWVASGVDGGLVTRAAGAPSPRGLLGDVARGRRAVRLRDVRDYPAFDGAAAHHPPMTSFLGVPLLHGARSVGALYVANRVGGDEFSDADELSANLLAQRASIAIEIALRLGRERRRSELLDAAGRVFGAAVDTRAAADAIVKVVVPELGDGAALSLVAPDGALRIAAAHHRDPARDVALRQRVGEVCPLPEAATRALLADGVPRRLCDAPAGGSAVDAGATLLLPLRRDREVVGLLHLAFERVTAEAYGEHELALATELAQRASMAMENARLHEVARRALAARDEILAFVTHDLGNFLNAIVLNARAIVRPDPAGRKPDADGHVEAIRAAAGRMTALLGALRDATSIEAGRFRVDARPNGVASLLAEAAAIFRAKAAEKEVGLAVDVEEELPPVMFDRERIHQVIANLLSNALDHAPAGGHVQLEAAEIAPGVLRIAVHDTGPGIDDVDVPRLFDRYWRKETPTRRGTGLGLYIAKGIVEAHGGNIGVDTERGRGASFFFTLRFPPRDDRARGDADRSGSAATPLGEIDRHAPI